MCVCVQTPLLKYLDVATVLCLLFTAFVTPVEVSFFSEDDGTFGVIFLMNRLVDIVFITVRLCMCACVRDCLSESESECVRECVSV